MVTYKQAFVMVLHVTFDVTEYFLLLAWGYDGST